jgi:hypothetical protein
MILRRPQAQSTRAVASVEVLVEKVERLRAVVPKVSTHVTRFVQGSKVVSFR